MMTDANTKKKRNKKKLLGRSVSARVSDRDYRELENEMAAEGMKNMSVLVRHIVKEHMEWKKAEK